MTEPLPEPLVPPQVDLRGYEFMPYYGDRLRESDLNGRATDAEYRAAHNLWWSAWKQIPAASLPNDDALLCKLADLGRDMKTWLKVKERALHGFSLCIDNRYYHQLLGVLAIDAWDARSKAIERGRIGASKRWNGHSNASTKKNDGKREDRKGEERKENQEQGARARRLPADWQPPENWIEWAIQEQPSWTAEHASKVAASFRDYWIAKPGTAGTKLDWEATWRNWVRKEKPIPASKQVSLEEKNRRVADAWVPPE